MVSQSKGRQHRHLILLPTVACFQLARALQTQGEKVAFAGIPNLRKTVESQGFAFYEMESQIRYLLKNLWLIIVLITLLDTTCVGQNVEAASDSSNFRITYILQSEDSYSQIESSKLKISLIDILAPYLKSLTAYIGEDAKKKVGANSNRLVIVYELTNTFVDALPQEIKEKYYKKHSASKESNR